LRPKYDALFSNFGFNDLRRYTQVAAAEGVAAPLRNLARTLLGAVEAV